MTPNNGELFFLALLQLLNHLDQTLRTPQSLRPGPLQVLRGSGFAVIA